MNHERLLAESIPVPLSAILTLSRMPLEGLNETWRCVLHGWPSAVFLKIQGERYPSDSVAEEGEALAFMAGRCRLVPALISRGVDAESGRAFIVVRGLPGHSLGTVLERSRNLQYHQTFTSLVNWLCDLRECTELRALLDRRAVTATGLWHPDFSPEEGIAQLLDSTCDQEFAWLREHSTRIRNATSTKSEKARDVIHGSLSTNNILVELPVNSPGVLSGVLDYEAVRIGDVMFDVATLALHLLMVRSEDAALTWFSACTGLLGEHRVLGEGLKFFYYLCLLRARAVHLGAHVVLPDRERVRAFLRHCGV